VAKSARTAWGDRAEWAGFFVLLGVIALLAPHACHSAERPPTDVCVYGATSAGVMAAVQCARMGRSVILLDPGRHLGGMTSGGLGATDVGSPRTIGGLAREFYDRVLAFYRVTYGPDSQQVVDSHGGYRFEPHVAERVFEDMVTDANLSVRRGAALAGLMKEGRHIVQADFSDGSSVRAAVYIDATYEGDLMATAGVRYVVGREDNATYGETLDGIQFANHNHDFKVPVDPYREVGKPESGLLWGISDEPLGREGAGDKSVQAYCFRMCLTRADDRLPLPKPADYDASRYELLLRYLHAGVWDALRLVSWLPNGKTDTNNHGGFSTDAIGLNRDYPEADPTRRAEIVAAHVSYQQGLLWFLSHDERVPETIRHELAAWGLPRDEFTDNGGWPTQLYVREARRLLGEYVMTEHNVRGRKKTDQPVAMASYGMDSHNCRRLVVDGRVRNEGNVESGDFPPWPIAFGAMLPMRRQCDNLIVPVCLSASHIAYGSIRMEPVFMMLGQAAGAAGALAAERLDAVQSVSYRKLRARLEADRAVLAWTAPPETTVAPRIDPASLPGIVLDDEEAVKVGPWAKSTTPQSRLVGTGYLHDGNGNKGEALATWQTTLPTAGRWQVILFAPPNANRATRVPVIIELDGHVQPPVYVNEGDDSFAGRLPLGTFDLKAGTRVKVTVSNRDTDGYVVVDGLQFLPLPPVEPTAPQAPATPPATAAAPAPEKGP
jgi:hypothetical protein